MHNKPKNLCILFLSILQQSSKKPYAFEYSVQDDLTGITHSRKETADINGVVRGVYEILEPSCVIRRVEYQADHVKGFKVLNTSQRSCQEQSKNNEKVSDLPYIVTPTATLLDKTERPKRKIEFSSPTRSPGNVGYIPPPPVGGGPTQSKKGK